MREDEGYKPSYGCTLICPNDKLGPLKKALQEVVVNKWGAEKGPQMWKNGLIKNPILAGDGKEARDKETGEIKVGLGPDVSFIRVTAGADHKPRIFDKDGETPIISSDDLPSGSWVYPVLNAYSWYHAQNGAGVGIGIEMVQLARLAVGDEVWGGSGRADPKKYFKNLEEDEQGDEREGKKPESAGGLFI